jgi:hypothetical protein
MPKYGIHGIVISKAIDALNRAGSAPETCSDMTNHRPFAMMGALGPDIFFWAPDYEVVEKLYPLYKNLEKLLEIYNAITKPIRQIKEAVVDFLDAVLRTIDPVRYELVKKLVIEMKETSQLFRASVSTGLFSGVLTLSDFITEIASLPRLTSQLFNLFVPPLQKQMENHQMHDVKTWYWFDMLHYRRTGRFASELITRARNGSPRQRAYAYGYLSHIATDLVGHAFVNQVVGDPYRLSVQRHTTAEYFMDAWAGAYYYNGASISKNMLTWFPLPDPDHLPGDILDLLDTSFRATYGNLFPTRLGNPGFLSRAQIWQSYEVFYKVMAVTGKMRVERPEEPFPGAMNLLTTILGNLLQPSPSPPGPPTNLASCTWEDLLSGGLTDHSRYCYEAFFDDLNDWNQYTTELLLWTYETSIDLFDLILDSLRSMQTNVLLALLYGVQLTLYQFYQTVRFVITQYGFITPEPEDLNHSISRTLTTTFLGCTSPSNYPRLSSANISQLVCPNLQTENPSTVPDFYQTSENVAPDSFIDQLPFDPAILSSYARVLTPSQTRQLEQQQKRVGNATDLTKWMIETASNSNAPSAERDVLYTDWNLDSDRGYGYKTWNGKLEPAPLSVQPEDYV